MENADSIIPLLSLNGLLWAEKVVRSRVKEKSDTCMRMIAK